VGAETVAGREGPKAKGEGGVIEGERECHWVCPL
jgi:hypothetical protein